MKPIRFAAVGDNCIDRFLRPVGHSLVGGNAVNVAVQLARLGARCSYFGAVGLDADGQRTVSILEDNGLDVSHVHHRPLNTAHTDIEVLASGERIMRHEDFGACAGYFPTPEEIDVLKCMDHVHIGWMDDGGRLRRLLHASGVSLSQDVSVNAEPGNLGVQGLRVAFASVGIDDDALDRTLIHLLASGAGLAVVTRGPKGAVASDGVARSHVSIRPVEVIDTTGAGDSFIAGFLSAFVAGLTVEASLAAGRDAAAITCTHLGGFPQPIA